MNLDPFSFKSLVFLKLILRFFLSFPIMAKECATQQVPSSQPNQQASYLYLHPNENPIMSLVLSVLDSTNYHSWSRSVMATMNAKNKVEVILTSHPCPNENYPTHFTRKIGNNIFFINNKKSINVNHFRGDSTRI